MVPSIDICLKHHTQYTGAAAAMSSPLTALSRNGVFDIVEQAAIRVCRASVFNVDGARGRAEARCRDSVAGRRGERTLSVKLAVN